ncbi:hypothetical protein B0H14DRAFT_1684536 [Mycena olivaceomarginata]|nr:hypothetical protein B0H14DRAFT_1684536 [Mycena olivaceomarginata]
MVRPTNERTCLSREQLAAYPRLAQSPFLFCLRRSPFPPLHPPTSALTDLSPPSLGLNLPRGLQPPASASALGSRKSSRRPFAHNVASSYALAAVSAGLPTAGQLTRPDMFAMVSLWGSAARREDGGIIPQFPGHWDLPSALYFSRTPLPTRSPDSTSPLSSPPPFASLILVPPSSFPFRHPLVPKLIVPLRFIYGSTLPLTSSPPPSLSFPPLLPRLP